MSYKEPSYREIITKAVCGKGKKRFTCTDEIKPNYVPTSVLGCWIINHVYEATRKCNKTVEVNGSYDINIWYAYDDNCKTEVNKVTIDYCDTIELSERDRNCLHESEEVFAKVIRQPNCIDCKLSECGQSIIVKTEREMLVQIIGETKVNVRIEDHDHK